MVLKVTSKKKGGRPKGSKTRANAPSKLAKLAKLNSTTPAATTAQIIPPDNHQTATPDTDIFGTAQLPHENKTPSGAAEMPETETGKTPDDSGDEKANFPDESETTVSPDEHRGLAIVIWDSITGAMAAFIGVFWLPKKEPFDEREMVVSAFAKYFASIGLKALTPGQELCVAIGGYTLPRLKETVDAIRLKFMKKAKPANPQPETDNRTTDQPQPAATETGSKPPPQNLDVMLNA